MIKQYGKDIYQSTLCQRYSYILITHSYWIRPCSSAFMIFAGIILAFVLRTGYQETESGEKFILKEYYFQHAMKAPIYNALESSPESIVLDEADKGNAIKLDIYYSKSSGKAYIKMFEYIPYRYEPCSKLYEYELAKVEKLIN